MPDDAGAFAAWMVQIEHMNRDRVGDQSAHVGAMNALHREVGQLRSFLKRQLFYTLSLRAQPRVCRSKSIDVGPELDYVRFQGTRDEGWGQMQALVSTLNFVRNLLA